MKICVYGAGAVGGNLAVGLMSLPRAEISVIARGPHLEAIQKRGLKLVTANSETIGTPLAATSNPDELPPQDIVFVTLKSPALSAAAPGIARLLKPEGHVVFILNGIPWWWHHGLQGPGQHLALVDPCKALWDGLGASRCIGCAVYSMNEVLEPGVIFHRGNNRWLLGEPNNQMSERLQATVGLMQQAGLGAEASNDIRRHVLIKLLRNSALSSLCALTRLDVQQLAQRADLVRICEDLSLEVARTAQAMGWNIDEAQQAEVRIWQAGGALSGKKVTGSKPSMLQDILAGRPMETDGILGELQQLARTFGVVTPAIDLMVSLLKGLEASISPPV